MEPPSPSPDNEPNTADRRESLRRRKQTHVLVTDGGSMAKPFSAWVVDRSLGGLRLSISEEIWESISEEIGPGAILNVRPASATAEIDWISVEVKSCAPAQNNWELGCQFLRVPSYKVLLLFG